MAEDYTPHECWMWLEVEPDGRTGLIATAIPLINSANSPLLHRSRDIAERVMGPLAALHAQRTGHQVRLAHMREVEE